MRLVLSVVAIMLALSVLTWKVHQDRSSTRQTEHAIKVAQDWKEVAERWEKIAVQWEAEANKCYQRTSK